MKKMLLTIGLALGVSAFTATAQQGQGKGVQHRQRAQIGQRGQNCPANGDCQQQQTRQRRGQGMGQGNGRRARQGLRDGTGPRSADGNCIRQNSQQTR